MVQFHIFFENYNAFYIIQISLNIIIVFLIAIKIDNKKSVK